MNDTLVDEYVDALLGAEIADTAAPSTSLHISGPPASDVACDARISSSSAASSVDVGAGTATDASASASPARDRVDPAPVATNTAIVDARAMPAARAPAAIAAPSGGSALAAASGGARSQRWLRLCIASDRYAFELLRIQEVVRIAPIVAMRGTAAAMLGVMNLRGRIVPVLDLGRWLGGGAVAADERARIVVVERDDELIGVLATAVEDVVSLGPTAIEPPLPNAAPGAVLGIARATGGGAPTVLLDVDALFA